MLLTKRKVKRFYLICKREVLLMSAKTIGASLIVGTVLIIGPMVGVAEETPATYQFQEKMASADTTLDKVKEVTAAAVNQGTELWREVFGQDEKLRRANAEIQLLRGEVTKLKASQVHKKFVQGLAYEQSVNCVGVIGDFFKEHVAPGGGN